MPTAAYEVGRLQVDKNGTLTGPDYRDLVADLQGLHGFIPTSVEYDEADDTPAWHDTCDREERDADGNWDGNETLYYREPRYTEEEFGLGVKRTDPVGENGMRADDAPENVTDQLVIEMPLGGFTPDKLDNLNKLVSAKSPPETAVGTVNATAESIAAAETARSFFDTYNPETVYVPGNKVTYGGSSYLSILTSSGIAPPDPYHWLLIASKGDRGEDGDKTFVHVQYEASEVWHINHNLNKYPVVTVIDSAGSVVVGNIEYNDINNISVCFVGGFSGRAICN